MPHRPSRTRAGAVAATCAVLCSAPLGIIGGGSAAAAPVAELTQSVTSFDGTQITSHFFPAPATASGAKVPTVLFGPGWGSPGATSPADPTVAGLGAQGYNVLTWDPRGFGTSGGRAEIDSVDFEARDVSALIDWVAARPEAQLDTPGDPRLGMVGASYGGAVQWVSAASDHRIDAIVPEIAWHSLLSSLYPDQTYKAGWSGLLCAAGAAGTNRVDPISAAACQTGAATGKQTAQQQQWFAERGPGDLLAKVRAPALILQGTVDTLFPLDESVPNYRALRATGTPVKLVWFCGGHGICLTNAGPAGHVETLTARWLAKYLKGAPVDTGPGFEYVDQTGVWHSAAQYPSRLTGVMYGAGSGSLVIDTTHRSGQPILAQSASNALTVAVRAPHTTGAALGAPQVTLAYRGTADVPATVLYGQLVDRSTGLVLGNQATPIPVTLDGRPHVVSQALESVAWAVGPDSDLVLQLTDATSLYTPQRSTGRVQAAVFVTLPVRSAG